jgi:CRISPR-associated endoribonuclease Cas6
MRFSMRIRIDMSRNPQTLRYNDSMNAAIIAALTAAGLTSEEVTGERALPWTFAMHRTRGRVRRQGDILVGAVTISSPAERVAEALSRFDPAEMTVTSSNGDRICGAGGLVIRDEPEIWAEAMTVSFASPVLLMRKKNGPEKTAWANDPEQVDIAPALYSGVSNRAGRALDLRITPVDGGYAERLLVPLRRDARSRADMILPAFRLPLRLEGAPEDVRFAFLAGFGAKTRAGFGCPTLMN